MDEELIKSVLTETLDFVTQYRESEFKQSDKLFIKFQQSFPLSEIKFIDPGFSFDSIEVDESTWEGKSVKPGNLFLYPSKVFFKSFDSMLAAVGFKFFEEPYLKYIAFTYFAIRFICTITGQTSIALTEQECITAYVLHCLKCHQDSELSGECSIENVTRCYNLIASRNQFNEISNGQIQKVLSKLSKYKCVEKKGEHWEILEIVKIS